VEPDAPRCAKSVLLVPGCGAAPGDELAALGIPAEVEAGIGVRLVSLGVDVVLEALARLLTVAPQLIKNTVLRFVSTPAGGFSASQFSPEGALIR
jgi:hypothetical protein